MEISTPSFGAAPSPPLAATPQVRTHLVARDSRSTLERGARKESSRAEAAIDAALVQRFNAGDESAFAEIVSRHTAKIQAVAEQFLRNRADGEEITQDTFIRAHRGLGTFRGDASLATWLHHIALNLARNRYWYFFRRCRHLTASLDRPVSEGSNATLSDVVPATDADPARQATVTEFSGLVTACMAKMKADQREILTLRNLLHRSYDQIAAALGINEGTVKSRIARARGSLRDLMVDACPEFPADSPIGDWFEPVRTPARRAA
jgi:RNA polymerase sigma-70 factor (ECF subfamily)